MIEVTLNCHLFYPHLLKTLIMTSNSFFGFYPICTLLFSLFRKCVISLKGTTYHYSPLLLLLNFSTNSKSCFLKHWKVGKFWSATRMGAACIINYPVGSEILANYGYLFHELNDLQFNAKLYHGTTWISPPLNYLTFFLWIRMLHMESI